MAKSDGDFKRDFISTYPWANKEMSKLRASSSEEVTDIILLIARFFSHFLYTDEAEIEAEIARQARSQARQAHMGRAFAHSCFTDPDPLDLAKLERHRRLKQWNWQMIFRNFLSLFDIAIESLSTEAKKS
ncbi:hypothetical protein FRC07_005326 [Ceratobasidium sp. 392]|nr:hypothetical protein FRC07_005326 [Ceratobasidium sp. 392]